jgi:hypothetical protein
MPDEQAAVAYKPLNVAGEIHVYYSTVFAPYKQTLDSLKSQGESMAKFFDNGYQIWIGYHAILQESAKKDKELEDLDPDTLETVLDHGRVRVAQMQVKQALHTAKLQFELMKAKSQAESAEAS